MFVRGPVHVHTGPMTDALEPLAAATATAAATDADALALVDSPDVIPEGARVPGYIMQYGVGIPVGVWVGALVALPVILFGDVLLTEVLVVPLALGVFAVAGAAATRAVVGRLRAFQERRLLLATDVRRTPRQLRGAGGSESPVAVRD
jgi:hypothetical protein